jgi:hypothetical protein
MTKARDVLDAIRYITSEFQGEYFEEQFKLSQRTRDYVDPMLENVLKEMQFPDYLRDRIAQVDKRYSLCDPGYVLTDAELVEFKSTGFQFKSYSEVMAQLIAIVYAALADKKYSVENPATRTQVKFLLTQHLAGVVKDVQSRVPTATQEPKESLFTSFTNRLLGRGKKTSEEEKESFSPIAKASSSAASIPLSNKQQQQESTHLKAAEKMQAAALQQLTLELQAKTLVAQQQEKTILELQQKVQDAKTQAVEEQRKMAELQARENKSQARLALLQNKIRQLEAEILASKATDINAIKQKLDKIRMKFTDMGSKHTLLKKALLDYDAKVAQGVAVAEQYILSKETYRKSVLYSDPTEHKHAKLVRDYLRVQGEAPDDKASVDGIKKGIKVNNKKEARERVLADHAETMRKATETKRNLEADKKLLFDERNSTLQSLIDYHTELSSFYQEITELRSAIAVSQHNDALGPLLNERVETVTTPVQYAEEEKLPAAPPPKVLAPVPIAPVMISPTTPIPIAPPMVQASASSSSSVPMPPSMTKVQIQNTVSTQQDKKPAVDMVSALQNHFKSGAKLQPHKPTTDVQTDKPVVTDILSSIKNRNQILAAEPTVGAVNSYINLTKILFKKNNEWIIALYKNKKKIQEEKIISVKEFSALIVKIANKTFAQLSDDERQQAMGAINSYRVPPVERAQKEAAVSSSSSIAAASQPGFNLGNILIPAMAIQRMGVEPDSPTRPGSGW